MAFCGICGYDIYECHCLDDGDEESSCNYCDGTGRVPAPDYLAIEGFSFVACKHCEAGLQWPEKF